MQTTDTAGDVSALTERIGLRFDDLGLVDQAMSHRSWCAENPGHESYERLEFLGDAVLGALAAEWLYGELASDDEGELSKVKSYVVSEPVLAAHARELGLGPLLRLGRAFAWGADGFIIAGGLSSRGLTAGFWAPVQPS